MQFTDVNTVSVNILWNEHLNSFCTLLSCLDAAMPRYVKEEKNRKEYVLACTRMSQNTNVCHLSPILTSISEVSSK